MPHTPWAWKYLHRVPRCITVLIFFNVAHLVVWCGFFRLPRFELEAAHDYGVKKAKKEQHLQQQQLLLDQAQNLEAANIHKSNGNRFSGVGAGRGRGRGGPGGSNRFVAVGPKAGTSHPP